MKALKRTLSLFLCIVVVTTFMFGFMARSTVPEADAAGYSGKYFLQIGVPQTIPLSLSGYEVFSAQWSLEGSGMYSYVQVYPMGSNGTSGCTVEALKYYEYGTITLSCLVYYWLQYSTGKKMMSFENTYVLEIQEPAKATVSFEPNEGSCTKEYTTVYVGKSIGDLPDAWRSGYNFQGWYTAPTSGMKITSSYVVNYDTTIYAHWEKISSGSDSGSSSTPKPTQAPSQTTSSTTTSKTNSTTSSTTTKTSALATPEISGFASLDAGTKIQWGKVSGAQKYRVYYKSDGSWEKLGDTTANFFVDKKVKSGTTRTYTVRCINKAGTKGTSGYNKSGKKYTYNMKTPAITGRKSTASGIKLTWGAVKNAKKYSVFRKSGSSWTKLGNTTKTTYTDKKVKKGKTYTYTVRCVSSSGKPYTSAYNKTGWKYKYNYTKSSKTTASVKVATPKITKTEVVSNGIKLTWGKVSGAKRYRVFYKNRNSWTKLLDTTKNTCVDTGAEYDSTITYTVRCLSADGKKYISGYDTKGKQATRCSNPKITGGLVTGAHYDIFTWDIECVRSDLVHHYKIYYKSGSKWVCLGSTKDGKIKNANEMIESDKEYVFTARGYDAAGNAVTYFNTKGFRVGMYSIW